MAYKRSSSLVCLFAIQFFLSFSAKEVQAKVPAVIVFGDSTVDAGNNNRRFTIAKCNFRPYGQDFEGGKPTGRWSNGRLFTDFISEALGLKKVIPAYLDPDFRMEDFATGVTFASGGAGYDNLTSTLVSAIPLWQELVYFEEFKGRLAKLQGAEKANETVREALYIVSLGTNDFMENYYFVPIRKLEFNMEQFQNYLVNNAGRFIRDLYNLGARKIALGGSVPMGCLPFARSLNALVGRKCVDYFNLVGRNFNIKLIQLVADLKKELDGIKLVYTDAYKPLSEMIEAPYKFGFEEVKNGCCGTGTIEINHLCGLEKMFVCKDPTKYIYWDAVHLTQKANGLLADNLLKTGLAELIVP